MSTTNNYSNNIQDNFLSLDVDKRNSNSEGKIQELSENGSDFETAITASGFGKFNILLYVISTFTGLATTFDLRSMSYVFPAAQCDLQLSVNDKAILNAASVIGMFISGFIWGYVGDTLGRRTLIIYTSLIDGVLCLVGAFSQTFILLALAKFFGGIIISGAYASLSSYLTEVHCAKHRAIVQLFIGSIYGLGDLLLPLLAIIVLPREIHWEIAGFLVIHPWNLYSVVLSLPNFISGIGFIFLPDSPKFLMSAGENDKALEVFKNVYRLNTGNPKESYPVKILKREHSDVEVEEIKARHGKISVWKIFSLTWTQMKPLFSSEYVKSITLALTIQFLILMGLDSMSLFLPQIFREIYKNQEKTNGSASVCDALDNVRNSNTSVTANCVLKFQETKIYTNFIIIASTSIAVFFISGSIVNIIGKKRLLYILGLVSGLCTTAFYFSKDIALTVTLSAISSAFNNIAFNALVAVVVDMVPTTLRAMSVSLTMSVGRIGAAIGCFIIPTFVPLGCAPPIFVSGFVILAWSQLVHFLPNTDLKALT